MATTTSNFKLDQDHNAAEREDATAFAQNITADRNLRQDVEPFCTIPDAARALGIKKFALERSVRKGEIPHYNFYNSRRLVRISEIVAFILASRQGGK